MSSEPDECLMELDKWIKEQKDIIYNDNIKSPKNDENDIINYTNKVQDYGKKIIRAIEKEDTETLTKLEWPTTLMSCILDLTIRTVLLDRIEDWLLTYPYVRSRLHLNELERENTGIY